MVVDQEEMIVADMGSVSENESGNATGNDTTPAETEIETGTGTGEATGPARVLHPDVLRLHDLARLAHTLNALVPPLGPGLGLLPLPTRRNQIMRHPVC